MKKLPPAAVWPRALSVSAVAFGLVCSVAPLQAQDAPAAPPPPPPAQDGTPPAPRDGTPPVPPDGTPRDGAPRGEGGRGEGRPRGEGGGRGEGGPRGERGEGGPRGEGGRGGGPRGEGGPGGMRPDETPEQRQQRLLQPYVDIVEDLTPEQKTRILVILEDVDKQAQAIRENEDMEPAEKRAAVGQIRAGIPDKVTPILTPAQATIYKAALADQAKAAAAMAKVGALRPNEDVQQMRERVLQGYEDAMEELSVKQKTQIIKILEASGEVMDGIIADTAQTPDQKRVAIDQQSQAVSAKVLPLLDADQSKVWKGAHEAKRKAWQQEALTPPTANPLTAPPADVPPAPPAPTPR